MEKNLLEVFLLSFLQGATEFLPVSSSGHLRLLHYFLGKDFSSFSFDIFLHFGTFFSIVYVYRKEIYQLCVSFFRDIHSFFYDKRGGLNSYLSIKYVLFVVITIVPAAIVGLLFNEEIVKLSDNISLIAINFFITGIFLLMASRFVKGDKSIRELSWSFPIVVGFFQSLALLPGISRSAMCITATIIMGMHRKEAVKYIFFIALPIFLGATLLEILKSSLDNIFNLYNIMGMVTSALVGVVFLKVFRNIVMKMKLYYFSVYLFILSMMAFYISHSG